MSMSPTTYGQGALLRRSPESGATARRTATGSIDRTVPKTDEDCERLLAMAARCEPGPDLAADLAPFLGAASRVWTPARRDRVRHLIAAVGIEAVPPVLAAVLATPRQEVIDEAVGTLVEAAREDDRIIVMLAAQLVARLQARPSSPGESPTGAPHVRATIVRVIGAGGGAGARELRMNALACALADDAPEVRDVAVQVLGTSADPIARQLLRARASVEPVAFLRDAIVDALEELGEA